MKTNSGINGGGNVDFDEAPTVARFDRTKSRKSRLSTSRKYARTPAVVGGPLVGDQVTEVSRGSRSFSNVALARSAALSPPGKTTWGRPKHAAAVNKL
jgi:hypothetical protein